jgi:hypothetical protein
MTTSLPTTFMQLRILACLFCGLSSALGMTAQDASVEVTVNSTNVNRGDVLRLAVTFVNCKVKEIDPPEIPGLEWRMGPSTSNSTQWVNGVTTSEQRYTYGYVVTGSKEIVIPPLTWNTNQGSLKSNSIRILVNGAGPSGGNLPNRTPSAKREVNRDLVTSIEPSKRTVYLGEPLVLSYKIYNRYNNLDVRNYDIPELEGFWKETIASPDARWEPQLINGKRYNVATVRQIVAFPQQTGKVVLDDFTLNGYLRINFFEGREIQATCDPVEIEVLPLPEAAPSNSLGTFANLTAEQRISSDSIAANEAVTLEITFRGTGNLKFLREPELAWPAEFEVFDPEVEDNISITARGESGTRKFKYVAIPRAPGDYQMPAFEATSFDPLTAQHVTSRAPGIKLHVSKDTNGEGSGSAGMTFTHQQDVQVLNRDVRHILTSPSRFLPKSPPAWAQWGLSLAFLASPLTYAGFAAARRARRREAQDAKGTRRKRALRVLQRALSNPEALTPEVLGETMEQYLMAKLGWERSQLTRDSVRLALLKFDATLAEEWDQMWVACEMVRYGASSGDLSELSRRLMTLAETSEATWNS